MADHNRNYKKKSIYIDDESYNKMKQKASDAGLSISAFVRETATSERLPQTDPLPAKYILEFGRLGNNLNQIARKFNSDNPDYVNLEPVLKKLALYLRDFQKELRQ